MYICLVADLHMNEVMTWWLKHWTKTPDVLFAFKEHLQIIKIQTSYVKQESSTKQCDRDPNSFQGSSQWLLGWASNCAAINKAWVRLPPHHWSKYSERNEGCDLKHIFNPKAKTFINYFWQHKIVWIKTTTFFKQCVSIILQTFSG